MRNLCLTSLEELDREYGTSLSSKIKEEELRCFGSKEEREIAYVVEDSKTKPRRVLSCNRSFSSNIPCKKLFWYLSTVEYNRYKEAMDIITTIGLKLVHWGYISPLAKGISLVEKEGASEYAKAVGVSEDDIVHYNLVLESNKLNLLVTYDVVKGQRLVLCHVNMVYDSMTSENKFTVLHEKAEELFKGIDLK